MQHVASSHATIKPATPASQADNQQARKRESTLQQANESASQPASQPAGEDAISQASQPLLPASNQHVAGWMGTWVAGAGGWFYCPS